MSREEMMKYLKEAFGIKSEEEMNKAIKALHLNIGIMTTGGKDNDNDSKVSRIRVH